jgi:Fe-Mn family superoxide dismutase
MRDIITLLEQKSQTESIEIIDTKYGLGDLAPVLSEKLIKFHYGKLAHAYAERFNKGEGDSEFNYAGVFLHNVLFSQFRESRTNNKPNGPVSNFINTKFKNYDNFKSQVAEAAMKLQGSGWIYLSESGTIETIHNHEVRDDILILIDMWEHAFQMDYGSDKSRYLERQWQIIDWNVINTRWARPYSK